MSVADMRQSVSVRLIVIGIIALVLLIPAFLTKSLIAERELRRDQVASEISSNWGGKQLLVGPILSIPFRYRWYSDKKELTTGIKYAHFLPERLDIEGVVNPEIRNRGIYETVLYNSELQISGAFGLPNFAELGIEREDMILEDAIVSMGISDMKGVRDSINILWNGEKLSVNSGVETSDLISSGFSVRTDMSNQQSAIEFSTRLNLNGSFELLFSPVGKETKVELTSNWQNPSFIGSFLPVERELNQEGFKSNWKILHINRDFPQQWVGSRYNLGRSVFGVNLLLSVDEYQKTMRTIKYAILFIALTFLTFFVIEILSNKAIHPIQYLLIGVALVIFYTLLLSLSEYIPFLYAYLIASTGIVTLISFYSISVLSDKSQTLIVAIVLIILYGYLYIVLQLQDFALIMGSALLFIALALMMYLTRRVDWFTVVSNKKSLE